MDPLTDADLSRLLTHVVIHNGRNPYALQAETFERLTAAGLTHRVDDDDDPGVAVEYVVTTDGRRVAEAMLAAGMAAVESR